MRRVLMSATLLGAAMASGSAGASDFWDRFHLDYLRMQCWPEPFVQADREVVISPLAAMTNNGWQMQNTLSHHLFDAETHHLTRAGQMKLQWILTQAPAHRRTVFVVRTISAQETRARVASVESHMRHILPDVATPEVLVSDIVPPGGAGDYFDNVDRQLKASVPIPRLPPKGGVAEIEG